MIDIILLTCNRLKFSKMTIDSYYERIETPFRLIVIDNGSTDGTLEYLQKLKEENKIYKLISHTQENCVNISRAYNEGYKFVESEFFITGQDDIIIPKLEPDVVQQLIGLLEKYPQYGGIGCRIQRIPNMNWLDGDVSPARKACSAYFRIQRKSDLDKLGNDPFGQRNWDDLGFMSQIKKIGKTGGWANNLWCNHLGYCKKRGYDNHERQWSYIRRDFDDYIRKPYPKIDPITNVPLKIKL